MNIALLTALVAFGGTIVLVLALASWGTTRTPVLERRGSLAERIARLSGAGHQDDGLHTLSGYKIDDLDYALMGAANACANIAFGPDATTGQWFAISKKSDLARQSFGNAHGSSDDGGKTWYTETAYLEVPKPGHWVSAEEIIWHHERVKALRQSGVERPERIRIMNEERQRKPWLFAHA